MIWQSQPNCSLALQSGCDSGPLSISHVPELHFCEVFRVPSHKGLPAPTSLSNALPISSLHVFFVLVEKALCSNALSRMSCQQHIAHQPPPPVRSFFRNHHTIFTSCNAMLPSQYNVYSIQLAVTTISPTARLSN